MAHIQGALNLGQEVKEKGKNPWGGNPGLNPYLISGPLIDMALSSLALDPQLYYSILLSAISFIWCKEQVGKAE